MSEKIDTVFEAADFSGYLKKKGGQIKSYRKRWFELRNQHLYYFKAQNQKSRPAGVIVLTNAGIVDDNTKKFGFKVQGEGLSRVYQLCAESESEKQAWMAELSKAVKNAGTKAQVGSTVKKAEPYVTETIYDGGTKKKISLDDFELVKVIGRGSFGKVMKVKKKDTGKIYAMKVLRKDMIIKDGMVAHTKAEKQILQQIRHPFIVGLHYAFQTPEKLFLVLDFLSGGELFFHLKEQTKFNEERAKFYTAEIVLAIEHLHKNDIIYRDLKPENVVLGPDGNICLTDFGLAKTCVSNASPAYTFCGTPEYLAPEILKGQGHAKAVDWWSLGILLYEMLVGIPPFYSENINEMYELILKAPLKFPNFVSSDAQSLLKGLLEREEFKRLGGGPSDAEEIKSHPFFASVDFDKLYKKETNPPFIPDVKDGDDTKFFDSEFTSEKAVNSFAEVIDDDADASFDDFDHNADEDDEDEK